MTLSMTVWDWQLEEQCQCFSVGLICTLFVFDCFLLSSFCWLVVWDRAFRTDRAYSLFHVVAQLTICNNNNNNNESPWTTHLALDGLNLFIPTILSADARNV